VCACNVNSTDPNATEQALIHCLEEYDFPYQKFRAEYLADHKEFKHILFTSTRKRSFTVFTKDNQTWLYTFGNAEKILESSSRILRSDNSVIEISENVKNEIINDIKKANKKSLRTLGIARKKIFQPIDFLETVEGNEEFYKVEMSGLTFLGFTGLKDPLRKDVKNAVSIMTRAGITVRMVTGDSKETAVSIARECGIIRDLTSQELVLTGPEFENMVGGLSYKCPKCFEDENHLQEIKIEMTQQVPDMARQGSTLSRQHKKICPKCKEDLQSTARNLEEFKKVEKSLKVISSCRPSDKYLLVASLKFTYFS